MICWICYRTSFATLQVACRNFARFKINKIDTIDQANRHLAKYIKIFNRRHAKPALQTKWQKNTANLDEILCEKIDKKTDSCGAIKFHGLRFLVNGKNTKNIRVQLRISNLGIFAVTQSGEKRTLKPLDYLGDANSSMTAQEEELIYRYLYKNAKRI